MVPGSELRLECPGNGFGLSPPSCLRESYWGMKNKGVWFPFGALPHSRTRRGLRCCVGAVARADKSCSAPGVQSPGCLHPCQTAPAWGKGEVLTSWCGFVPFSRVQTCWNGEVQDGAGSGQVDAPFLKNPLAPEAGG